MEIVITDKEASILFKLINSHLNLVSEICTFDFKSRTVVSLEYYSELEKIEKKLMNKK